MTNQPTRATVALRRKGRDGWKPSSATIYTTATRRVMLLVARGNQLQLTRAEAIELSDALRSAALDMP